MKSLAVLPSREEKIARQSFKSSAIITAGNLISKVFLLIASLVVARLLGPSAYGIYSLALALPLFLQVLVGFGTRTAINRFSAFHISRGDFATAQRMTINSVLFLALTSLGLTALSVALAGAMSSVFLNRPELTLYVQIASILILGQAFFNYLTPAFVGWGAPIQDAIWTIVQAILKLGISVGLLLLGLGVFGALWGYALASLLAGVFGVLALYITTLKKSSHHNELGSPRFRWSFTDFVSDVKQMVQFGMPVYVGTIILNLSQQPVLTVILAYIASTTIIGYYSAASNLTQTFATVSAALTPAFFAAFASLDGIKSDKGTAFKYAVKYVSYFMMPLVMFLVVTSSLLVGILYGHAYIRSTYFLELLTLAYLPYAFGYTVLIPFINGSGKTTLNMLIDIIEALATIIPALVLILLLKLGVNGLLYTVMISNVAPTVFGMYSARKYLGGRVDYVNLLKTFAVSVFCFFSVYGLSLLIPAGFSQIGELIIDSLVFLGLYLTLMPLIGAVKLEDISRLRVSTHGIKGLSGFLHLILDYESLLVRRINRGSSESY
ncbi:MAG: oligosaccharide flippase family protein [archaeon]|nr:oligosaccharide flippase family protein [archaeon]